MGLLGIQPLAVPMLGPLRGCHQQRGRLLCPEWDCELVCSELKGHDPRWVWVRSPLVIASDPMAWDPYPDPVPSPSGHCVSASPRCRG